MTHVIVVSDYDPRWPDRFQDLRQRLAPHVADLAVSIEHVGRPSPQDLYEAAGIDGATRWVRFTT